MKALNNPNNPPTTRTTNKKLATDPLETPIGSHQPANSQEVATNTTANSAVLWNLQPGNNTATNCKEPNTTTGQPIGQPYHNRKTPRGSHPVLFHLFHQLWDELGAFINKDATAGMKSNVTSSAATSAMVLVKASG